MEELTMTWSAVTDIEYKVERKSLSTIDFESAKADMGYKNDIVKKIKELAAEYTPEWHYDEKNNDIGACLAKVYANMCARTLSLYQAYDIKYRINFLNLIKADTLPAKASSGYVTFQLVNFNVPGCFVPAGTRIYAEIKNEIHKNVFFETAEDLYVSPVNPDYIYSVSNENDYISLCYSSQDKKPFELFSCMGENLQEHEMYVASDMFAVPAINSVIEIDFYNNYRDKIPKEMLDSMLNQECISISTYTNAHNGYTELIKAVNDKGTLCLSLNEDTPTESKVEGINNIWIKFHVGNFNVFREFGFENMYVRSRADKIKPDAIYSIGEECMQDEYMPFGIQMGYYQEVLFASSDVLNKKGAKIKLGFQIDFVKTPLNTNVVKDVEWNWVMDKKQFDKEVMYEISIGKVIWEYYNGRGFVRLFPNDTYSDVFTYYPDQKKGYQEICFICPDDMKSYGGIPISACCIRARIVTMNHEYKLNGYYVSPILSDTYFEYQYENLKLSPDYIYVKNNAEGIRELKENQNRPFYQSDMADEGMYIGFKEAFKGDAIKLLFIVNDKNAYLTKNDNHNSCQLNWEYLSDNGFQSLNVIDETEFMMKSGIITISMGTGMTKKTLFNKELYWIRIIDINGCYKNNSKKGPQIEAIHMNTVKASAVDFCKEEHFMMTEYEADKQFKLNKTDILECRVYIEEGAGSIKWIEWERVDDFLYSKSDDRHYKVEAADGILCFGNGTNGMIPPASKQNNIKVIYKSGGGVHGNVSAGEISKMSRSIGYINKVCNFEAFSGGTDRESIEAAITRNTHFIKHRGQALTAGDYETLVREAFSFIKAVSCKTGMDAKGKKKLGCVTLIIVLEGYQKGMLCFDEMKEEIYQYIVPKIPEFMSKNGLFAIRNADYAEARIKIQIIVNSYKVIHKVKNEIEDIINHYFHSSNGLKIGMVPKSMKLKNAISGIKEIVMIKHVKINYYMDSAYGMSEKNSEDIVKNPFIYIVKGEHDIYIDYIY